MNDREALKRLLLERSVQRGDFVLASGRKSSYYIDCRLTTMSAEGLNLIGRCGLQAISQAGWELDVVGGLTMGADPVAYAIAAASFAANRRIDAFSVRKEAKAHGTKRTIEGNFTTGVRALVVEDVITTGGSALQAIRAVEGSGGIVAGVLAVVDREEGGREAIADAGFEVVALTTTTSMGLNAR